MNLLFDSGKTAKCLISLLNFNKFGQAMDKYVKS